jgi:hypothetical protein
MDKKEKHAEYMRNWRLKQREKQDEIEERLIKQANKISQHQHAKRKEPDILDENYGREVETHLEPQYQKQNRAVGCLWGLPDDDDKPKPKSFQDILRDLDPKHSE